MILTASLPSSAQDSFANARQLYASADYKGALMMLNTLLSASPSPQERQSIELYRTFCLVAIGNTDEANKAIESMVSRDPLYRPNMDDVPPRLRTVFSDARKRLLPAWPPALARVKARSCRCGSPSIKEPTASLRRATSAT